MPHVSLVIFPILYCLACADVRYVSEIRNGPVGRHQYEQRVGDILSNDFLIVSVTPNLRYGEILKSSVANLCHRLDQRANSLGH